mmetsp:Transcript_76385/g.163816  ORF Transcript_76385/g.163816 Transcript_76385/m.163816 type:complete len:210 (+) Transcript_76385:393-1022(+)
MSCAKIAGCRATSRSKPLKLTFSTAAVEMPDGLLESWAPQPTRPPGPAASACNSWARKNSATTRSSIPTAPAATAWPLDAVEATSPDDSPPSLSTSKSTGTQRTMRNVSKRPAKGSGNRSTSAILRVAGSSFAATPGWPVSTAKQHLRKSSESFQLCAMELSPTSPWRSLPWAAPRTAGAEAARRSGKPLLERAPATVAFPPRSARTKR